MRLSKQLSYRMFLFQAGDVERQFSACFVFGDVDGVDQGSVLAHPLGSLCMVRIPLLQ